MSVKARQALERRVIVAAIDGLLAAGFRVGVNDTEETVLQPTTDKAEVLAALFACDEEYLITAPAGWVRLVYGNDGWDVVNDYTTNLEAAMAEANQLADTEGGK